MMIDIIMTLLIVGVNGILAKILPEKYDFDKKSTYILAIGFTILLLVTYYMAEYSPVWFGR